MKKTIDHFTDSLITLNRVAARKISDEGADRYTPLKFIEDVVATSLERIGQGWQEGTYALSQVYMAGRICEDIVDELLPLGDPNRKDQPRIAICVLKDHHQLGKIIVCSVLRASGFEVMDYGVVDVDDVVERVQKDKIEMLLISVLMLPSALRIKAVKEKLDALNLNVKLVVGGAPFRFDDRLWKSVDADAVCGAASEAVSMIEKMMGGKI